MRTCINRSHPTFKATAAIVGEFQAIKDYLEYGRFRQPEEVEQKLKDLSIPYTPEDSVYPKMEIIKKNSFDEIAEIFQGDSVTIARQGNQIIIPFSQDNPKIKTLKQALAVANSKISKVKTWARETIGVGFTEGWAAIQDTTPIDNFLTINMLFPVNLQRALESAAEDQLMERLLKEQQQEILEEVEKDTPVFYKDLPSAEESISAIQDFLFPRISKELSGDFREIAADQIQQSLINDAGTAGGILRALIDRLADQVGVPYEIVDTEAAGQLLGDRYSGEAAFFYNDVVYLVNDKMTTKSAFHEFSHPLVRSISRTNPELFSELFKRVNTEAPQTVDHVKKLYPELDPESVYFQEEVIVHALTESAQAKYNGVKAETGLLAAVKEILFQIKQLLRKVFGSKIDISKLDAKTSLEDLAVVLSAGGHFRINTEDISNDEMVSFIRENKELSKEIADKVEFSTMTETINRFYTLVNRQINLLQGSSNYKQIYELLKDEYGKSYFTTLRQRLGQSARIADDQLIRLRDLAEKNKDGALLDLINEARSKDDYTMILNLVQDKLSPEEYEKISKKIKDFHGELDQKLNELKSDLDFQQDRAEGLIESMYTMDIVSGKMYHEIQELAKSPDVKENVHKIMYYTNILNYWDTFFREVKSDLLKENVDREVSTLINNILDNIKRARTESKKIYKAGSVDLISEQVSEIQNQIDQKYTQLLDHLQKTNQPQWVINKYKDEYHKNSIRQWDPENQKFLSMQDSIEKYLDGELGDAHATNSFFEGYMYNQDPVVFGFAKYVKDNFTDVLTTSQELFNNFAADITPALAKIGYNPMNIGNLGQQITFEDTIGYVDPDKKEFVPKKIHTFLNPNKDWRFALAQKEREIDAARKQANLTGSDSHYEELAKLQADFRAWKRKYFYQPYSDEVYHLDRFFNDEVGQKASARKQAILDKIQRLSTAETDEDLVELEDAWREYDNLFTELNKTGLELEIAQRLNQYKEASKEFYETVPREGAFEKAYLRYISYLKDTIQEDLRKRGLKGQELKQAYDNEFATKRDIWLRNNSEIKLTSQFWSDRAALLSKIQELQDKVQQSDEYLDKMKALTEEKNTILKRKRDDRSQYNVNKITEKEKARLSEIEDQLERLKETKIGIKGLTNRQMARLGELGEQVREFKKGNPFVEEPTEAEVQEFESLKALAQEKGLSHEDRKELKKLWKEYNEMVTYEPSDYYIQAFDKALMNVPLELRESYMKKLGFDQPSISGLKDLADASSVPAIYPLLEDEEFKTWFNKVHKKRQITDSSGAMGIEYRIRNMWSSMKPADPKYYETTVITAADGTGLTETLSVVPNNKYNMRRVKDKYRTAQIIGKTRDNKGKWLPRNRDDMQAYYNRYTEEFAQGEQWDQYINHEYYRIKEQKPDLFTVLEKLTDHHLTFQEGLGIKSRLYMDVPRFYKSNLETLQSRSVKANLKNNPISIAVKRVRDFLTNTKKAYLDGQNFQDEVDLVNLDMFDDEISGIPIGGIHYLDPELVSLDVINSMMRYMLSGERQKKLISMLPAAKALQQSLLDEENQAVGIKDKTKVDKRSFFRQIFGGNNNKLRFLSKKGENTRLKTINNLIAREFEGQSQAGITKDMARLNKFSQLLFGRASFGYFALNIPSAVKNNLGQQFQSMLHAVGGGNYNFRDLATGEAWSFKVSTMISTNIYNRKQLPLELQLVEIMDPDQGRTTKKFGDRLSRTLLKDVTEPGILYNTRQWLQIQAILAVFGASLNAQKITQTNDDGSTKEIKYLDAWEINPEGNIVLKKGVDPEWGKGGKKFKAFVNRQHDLQNRLSGAYAPWEQPEANRYLLFRLVSYLRKFFTRMFLNRFQMKGKLWNPRARYNVGAGEVELGWYVEGIQAIMLALATKGKYLGAMGKKEKMMVLRMFIELGALITLGFLIPAMFGWDPDDEEKYAKLREKSGHLPFLFAPSDEENDFNLWGFMQNHALLMSMQVRQENEAFLPIPGFGMDDYTSMANLSSIAYGPTIEAYVKIGQNVNAAIWDDDSAYYQRDTGPYQWQREGGFKGLKVFAGAFGFTGTSIDPVTAIKTFQGFRTRAK